MMNNVDTCSSYYKAGQAAGMASGFGVSTRAILNTLRNPDRITVDPLRNTVAYYSKQATVVLSTTTSKIVTLVPRSSIGRRLP